MEQKQNNKPRVLVGMSGGIDSSATCILLQEQGYEVVGLTMRVWDLARHFKDKDQEYPNYIMEAKALAEKLDMPHYVVDERKNFREVVVQNFIEEYLSGRTPNPCVMCNPLFKFRILTEWADKLGCDYIATGHYVRLEEEDGKRLIRAGYDPGKDQSYFLWRLEQDVLKRCIFPLGGKNKTDIREYLASKGFVAKAKEGESMEVCFIEGDYRDFLKEHIPNLAERIYPGKFVDAAGRVMGQHQGCALFTVGQRKGLGVAFGKPTFVLKINAEKNTVMLGDAEDLLTEYMLTEKPIVVNEEALYGSDELTVKIRYRSKGIACTVEKVTQTKADGSTEEMLLTRFKSPASAITPGQSAVFYVGDRIVAGAYIASQRGIGYYIAEKK